MKAPALSTIRDFLRASVGRASKLLSLLAVLSASGMDRERGPFQSHPNLSLIVSSPVVTRRAVRRSGIRQSQS
ncbi:hypothetical protein ACFPJ5_02985, partial [Salinirubrum litoreum]